MGTSEYDPGVGDRPAWNAGRKVGAKPALKPKQIDRFQKAIEARIATFTPKDSN